MMGGIVPDGCDFLYYFLLAIASACQLENVVFFCSIESTTVGFGCTDCLSRTRLHLSLKRIETVFASIRNESVTFIHVEAVQIVASKLVSYPSR